MYRLLVVLFVIISVGMSESIRLIPDWETDVVFVAPPQDNYYYKNLTTFYNEFLRALSKHDRVVCFVGNDNYDKIPNVIYVRHRDLDVWMRDFGPISTSEGFYQFLYKPDYISNSMSKSIRDAFKKITNNWKVNNLDIINDGGNLVHNGEVVVVTNKIYDLNSNIQREKVNEMLYSMGATQLVALPYDKYDRTGHIDGMVKWIDKKRLFVGKLDNEKLNKEVRNILSNALPDVQMIDLPCSLDVNGGSKGWESVNGLYINYLQTKNAVYVPLFGRNEDYEVMEIMKSAFNKPVEFINGSELAKYGGVINCASWNTLSDLVEPWLSEISN